MVLSPLWKNKNAVILFVQYEKLSSQFENGDNIPNNL